MELGGREGPLPQQALGWGCPHLGSGAPGKDALLGFRSGSRRVTAIGSLNFF